MKIKTNSTPLVLRKLDSILEYLKVMHSDLVKEKSNVKDHG
jgi:hypothetical protein